MRAANALNFLLAIALVLMAAKLHLCGRPPCALGGGEGIIGGDDGPTAIWLSSRLSEALGTKETPTRDFHDGATLPPARPQAEESDKSAADFALAALGADAAALTAVPKADAATSATPRAPEAAPEATTTGTFRPFNVREDFGENPFDLFTGKGLLLCAGDREKSNAMTIGWGGLGTIWGRNDAVTVYVAEKRHTKLFMDKAAFFTVMAFDKEKQADILDYMGRHSGRDGDKAAALGLHLAYTERGTPYYEEAQMVLECETMYAAPFDSAGMKDVPRKLYANFPAGVHSMYIGRIVAALKK